MQVTTKEEFKKAHSAQLQKKKRQTKYLRE